MPLIKVIVICLFLIGCTDEKKCASLLDIVASKYDSINSENLPEEWSEINSSCMYQEREDFLKLMSNNLNRDLHKTGT
jgi:hypothetical protein